MDAIHIIMATSTSANPHNVPNERIENIVRKRKLSAITFLMFAVLLIITGSLLVSFESQRFSVSFILFGIIGILFAGMYWISAEKLLIALRKFNANQMRQIQLQAQDFGAYHLESMNNIPSTSIALPTYDQSVLHHPTEIPPPYDEAIKMKSNDLVNNNEQPSSNSTTLPMPKHSASE